MKEIPLTYGKVALVSDSRHEELSRYYWRVSSSGYAYTVIGKRRVYMHRFITNAPKGMEVDHINRVRLDNQDHNLRIVTKAENLKNRGTDGAYKTHLPSIEKGRKKMHRAPKARVRNVKPKMYMVSEDDVAFIEKSGKREQSGVVRDAIAFARDNYTAFKAFVANRVQP